MPDRASLQRVTVVGISGSGKTRLAQLLAGKLAVPHIELDALFWGPGWQPVERDVFRTRVAGAVAGSAWVSDGNYHLARDLIWGNELANRLEGRGGNDVLDGYEGADTLIGGAGADTFKFHNIEKGDHIVDFSHNEGDKIDLTGFKNLDGSTFHFTFIGSSDFAHHAGELRYAGGQLQADFNGDGVADFAIFLDNSAPIVVSDLIIG